MSIRSAVVHIACVVCVTSSCQKSAISLAPDGSGGAGGAAGQGSGGRGAGGQGSGGSSSKPDAGFGGSGGMGSKLDAGLGGSDGGGGNPWILGGRTGSADAMGPDVTSSTGSGGSGGGATGGSFAGASGGVGGAGGRGGMVFDARPWGGSGGSGASLDSGASSGDAVTWDASSDGLRWSSCYPPPKCSSSEVLVRTQSTAVGIRGCACMANPCSSSPPNCGCAFSLCGPSATCLDYVPDPGVLVCSEKG